MSGADDLAIAAIEARIDQLKNITAEYDLRVDHDFDPGLEAPTDADKDLEDKFTESSNCRFSFLNGGARFESYATSKTIDYWKSRGLPLIREQIQTRSATARCEELSEQLEAPGPPSYVGSIAGESQFPEDWTVDLALGLRIYREQRWLDRQDIEGAVRVKCEDSNIVVLQIPGKDAVGFVHELRFDKRLMYAWFATGAPSKQMDRT